MSSTSIQIRIQACTQTNTSLGCISKWLQSAPTLGSPCSWSQMKCQDPATFVQNDLWNTIDSTSICSTCLRCTEDPRAFFFNSYKKKTPSRDVYPGTNNEWLQKYSCFAMELDRCCTCFLLSIVPSFHHKCQQLHQQFLWHRGTCVTGCLTSYPRKITNVPWKWTILKEKVIFQPSICRNVFAFRGGKDRMIFGGGLPPHLATHDPSIATWSLGIVQHGNHAKKQLLSAMKTSMRLEWSCRNWP